MHPSVLKLSSDGAAVYERYRDPRNAGRGSEWVAQSHAFHPRAERPRRCTLPGTLGDWSGFEIKKTIFLHSSAPAGWWEEYTELTKRHPGPIILFAQLSMAPFTERAF
jgi:hypothetical protein